MPSPIPHDIPFAEDPTSDNDDDVLLAHVISTKTANKPVKDEDMDYPRNWKEDLQGDYAVGHNKNGRTIALHALAVAPDYQRAGLGKAIMRVYIQRTKSLNAADRISILTYDRLVPYYQRLGFEHYGKSESEYAGVAWHDLVSDLNSRMANTNWGIVLHTIFSSVRSTYHSDIKCASAKDLTLKRLAWPRIQRQQIHCSIFCPATYLAPRYLR